MRRVARPPRRKGPRIGMPRRRGASTAHSEAPAHIADSSRWQPQGLRVAEVEEVGGLVQYVRGGCSEAEPWVRVGPSAYLATVPGAVAGRGLFAARDFKEGDAIIKYDGTDLGGERDTGIERKKRGKRHLLGVAGRVLDGEWHVAGAANTAVRQNRNNVVIAGNTGVFRAACNIVEGTELLVDYGRKYRRALAAESRARAAGAAIMSDGSVSTSDEYEPLDRA